MSDVKAFAFRRKKERKRRKKRRLSSTRGEGEGLHARPSSDDDDIVKKVKTAAAATTSTRLETKGKVSRKKTKNEGARQLRADAPYRPKEELCHKLVSKRAFSFLAFYLAHLDLLKIYLFNAGDTCFTHGDQVSKEECYGFNTIVAVTGSQSLSLLLNNPETVQRRFYRFHQANGNTDCSSRKKSLSCSSRPSNTHERVSEDSSPTASSFPLKARTRSLEIPVVSFYGLRLPFMSLFLSDWLAESSMTGVVTNPCLSLTLADMNSSSE